jgi:hypothetical protein
MKSYTRSDDEARMVQMVPFVFVAQGLSALARGEEKPVGRLMLPARDMSGRVAADYMRRKA